MVSLKRKKLSLSEKYKSEVDSGTKPLKVAEICDALRNIILIWLVPGKKRKLKLLFNLVSLAQKEKREGRTE